jgi:hypothetical protein
MPDLEACKQACKYHLCNMEDKFKEEEVFKIGPSQYGFINHCLELPALTSLKMWIALL